MRVNYLLLVRSGGCGKGDLVDADIELSWVQGLLRINIFSKACGDVGPGSPQRRRMRPYSATCYPMAKRLLPLLCGRNAGKGQLDLRGWRALIKFDYFLATSPPLGTIGPPTPLLS